MWFPSANLMVVVVSFNCSSLSHSLVMAGRGHLVAHMASELASVNATVKHLERGTEGGMGQDGGNERGDQKHRKYYY